MVMRGALFLLVLAVSPLAAQDTALVPPPPRGPDIQMLPVAPVPRHPR
ncbi:MAG: hypothetical protein O9293_10215 [Porphyrobacter sp.]|nr:hypothetical protein [Porphyrobacter sp.]